MEVNIKGENMKVGDIVKVTSSFMGEPANTLAYVYEKYQLGGDEPGISLITENGVDLGGFSAEEQSQWVTFVKHSGFYYQFKNVLQLDRDWSAGVFSGVFGKEDQDSLPEVKVACTKGHEKSCFYAKSDSCECDCNGENHGRAYAEKH